MGKPYMIRILGNEPVDEDVIIVIIIAGMIFLLFFIVTDRVSFTQKIMPSSSLQKKSTSSTNNCVSVPPPSNFANNRHSAKQEVLIDGNYYDVTHWSKFHPGGRVINYYTESGEDATIPFLQFHNRSMSRVLLFRKALSFRRDPEEDWDELQKRNATLTKRFKLLHEQFDQEGLFNPSLSHVIVRISEFLLYLFMARYILYDDSNGGICIPRIIGVLILATAHGRIVWLGHEGGHNSLTGKPRVDAFLQKLLYGCGNGLSASWWNHNHHKHHAMPQRIHRDVDLDTLPLIAFTMKCFNKKKINSFFVKYQAILFLPLTTFIIALRWSLHLHPKYCYRKKQYFELICISAHFLLFGPCQFGVVNFLLAKWLWSMYMFGNFSISHTHLEVSQEPKHWVEYAFENTVNIKSTPFMDWWMGFLNFQIEHHLFPTMCQVKGPLIKERVKLFAEQNGLSYQEMGYFEAVRATLTNLQNVSQEACKI